MNIKRKSKKIIRRFVDHESVKQILKMKNRSYVWYFIIIFFFFLLFLKVSSVQNSFNGIQNNQQQIIDEVGNKLQQMEDLKNIQKEYIKTFAEDINDIRSYLLLPTGSYDFLKERNEENFSHEDDLSKALLHYLDNVSSEKDFEVVLKKKSSFWNDIKKDEELQNCLNKYFVHFIDSPVRSDDNLAIFALNRNDERLLSFYLKLDKDVLVVRYLNNRDEHAFDGTGALLQSVISYFQEDTINSINTYYTDLKNRKKILRNFLDNEDVTSILKTKNLVIQDIFTDVYQDGKMYIQLEIIKASGEFGASVFLDPNKLTYGISPDGEHITWFPDDDIFVLNLKNFLKKIDERSLHERIIDTKKQDFINLLNDEAIQDFLENKQLSISDSPVEEDDRFYFDVLDDTGMIIQKIILEKGTGEFKIVDENGINEQSIFDFIEQPKKKFLIPDNIPQYSSAPKETTDSLNILLSGKHSSLVDTIILVHIDNTDHDIFLISIPRDLFFNGRKINSVYAYYGMNELKRQLSQITGIKIDKYVLVDMYAFADIVDLLGGIDVVIDQDLIDPSYKTFDNGKWGTLYYKKGTHHVNGRQALRLARSRHYSSDFARSERQHKILEGLKIKARNLGFGDADAILNIIKTVINKTETDISLKEALSYYFRYQNFELKKGAVISTGNVLESNYQNIYESKSETEKNKGSYILLPKNENWDIIKWYVQKIIDS